MSINPEFNDGGLMTIRFQEMTYYDRLKNYWDEHYVCKTPMGLYFVLECEDEMK